MRRADGWALRHGGLSTMKRFLLLLAVAATAACVHAQRPFEGFFFNEELRVKAQLNLYADSIEVPGLELERCYGYLQGGINGMWVVLSVKHATDTEALVRAVSERGGDAQNIELRVNSDGGIDCRLRDENNIKGVKNGKYVRLPKPFVLQRMGK